MIKTSFTWASTSGDLSHFQRSQTLCCTGAHLFSRPFECRCCSQCRGSVGRSRLDRAGSPTPCPSWLQLMHRHRNCRLFFFSASYTKCIPSYPPRETKLGRKPLRLSNEVT